MDYVPTSLDTETAENITNIKGGETTVDAQATNKVQVDFEDLTTVYAKLNLNDNMYLKAGLVQ